MSKIQTGLVHDQHTFEFELQGVTIAELKVYCKYARLYLSQLQEKDTYFIPGHYFLGLFRYIIPQIAAKDKLFPFQQLISWDMSTSGTLENRILIDQDIVMKMQERTRQQKGKYWFYIEFVRKADEEVVLSGIFAFVGHHI